MMTLLFVIGAAVTVAACMFANLMSAKPDTLRSHLRSMARLGIITACAFSVARVLTSGDAPSPERVLLMWSLAVLYGSQIRFEVVRQAEADDTDRAGV